MTAIELKPGVPFCDPAELNRIGRQQGLCLAIAQAAVFDEICQAVSLHPDQEAAELQVYRQRYNITTPEGQARYLRNKGWSEEDLGYFATKSARINQFKQRVFQQEVEVHFLDRKLDFDQVTYSLIRVTDENLAFELHQRLLEQEASFEDLAATYSEGSERQSGGSIGPVPLSLAHEAVVQKLRTSQPGELLEPFFLVNIWLIIRLDAWRGARLEEAQREEILEDLFNQWLNQRVLQLLAGQRPNPLPLHLLSEATELIP